MNPLTATSGGERKHLVVRVSPVRGVGVNNNEEVEEGRRQTRRDIRGVSRIERARAFGLLVSMHSIYF